MNASSTRELAAILLKKRDCLARLAQLGQLQLNLIAGGDLNELMKTLAAKQRYLAELQDAERLMDPFRGEDPERRVWSSPAERASAAKAADDCERLLALVLRQEQQSEQSLVVHRDSAARELQGMHAAQAARGAYAEDRIGAPSQLDLTCDFS